MEKTNLDNIEVTQKFYARLKNQKEMIRYFQLVATSKSSIVGMLHRK